MVCLKCGKQLPDEARFCINCGIKVGENSYTSQRLFIYEGKIHKCPSCGGTIEAFMAECPSCRYELRDVKHSAAVAEFISKLEEIEKTRKEKNTSAAGIAQEKLSLIQNFVIPNTKEDIIEFVLLAASNVELDAYNEDYGIISQFKNARRKEISDAWLSKLEQGYRKAKLVLASDPRLHEIQELRDSIYKSVNKVKWRTLKIVGIAWGSILAIAGLVVAIVFTSLAISKNNEVKRLETAEEKIVVALEECDYRFALMNADCLRFNGSDDNIKREWEIKREYWIDKVIEEALKNGVILERPIKEPEENSIGAIQSDLKFENFMDVKSKLEKRGFTNIKTHGLKDLSSILFSQDGKVEKVTVDGETGFSADVMYPLDVEIIIYYHSFKD